VFNPHADPSAMPSANASVVNLEHFVFMSCFLAFPNGWRLRVSRANLVLVLARQAPGQLPAHRLRAWKRVRQRHCDTRVATPGAFAATRTSRPHLAHRMGHAALGNIRAMTA
jgi:hypothetical protein